MKSTWEELRSTVCRPDGSVRIDKHQLVLPEPSSCMMVPMPRRPSELSSGRASVDSPSSAFSSESESVERTVERDLRRIFSRRYRGSIERNSIKSVYVVLQSFSLVSSVSKVCG